MTVVLATTHQTFRAHIAAGVLQEHGIEAWVWQDLSSSGYGPLTTGGCQLVVAPENAEEATKILTALPVDQGEADPESEQTERSKSLSLANAIGSGVIHGACLLPILLLVVLILRLALSMLGIEVAALHFTAAQFLASVFGLTIGGVIWGAIVGVPIGILIWLLSAWRNDHPAGKIFIRLVMTALCLLAALNL